MKRNFYRLCVGACMALLAVGVSSCSKENDPVAEQSPQNALKEAIVGKYWSEEIYFVRMDYGKISCDDIVIFGYEDGSMLRPDCVAMENLYVNEDGKVFRYFKNEYGIYPSYYANQYTISYHPDGQSIRIDAKADSLRYMGAVTGLDMMVKEVYDDKIVFDVPFIKEFVATTWRTYRDDPYFPYDRIVGLRICWKQMSPVNFQYAEPLD